MTTSVHTGRGLGLQPRAPGKALGYTRCSVSCVSWSLEQRREPGLTPAENTQAPSPRVEPCSLPGGAPGWLRSHRTPVGETSGACDWAASPSPTGFWTSGAPSWERRTLVLLGESLGVTGEPPWGGHWGVTGGR